jgi:hypothetical protein
MTTTVILLNVAMAVPAALVFAALALFVVQPCPGMPGEEGRADPRGPSRRPV